MNSLSDSHATVKRPSIFFFRGSLLSFLSVGDLPLIGYRGVFKGGGKIDEQQGVVKSKSSIELKGELSQREVAVAFVLKV